MILDRAVPPNPFDFLPVVPPLRVTSKDFEDGGPLGKDQLGADRGENVSPALEWDRGPAGTGSYAVICIDPDAPTPGGVWHWVLADIPGDVQAIPSGVGSDVGRSLLNDLGSLRYEGAAPPPGDRPHRYIFAVCALGVERLELTENTPAALTGFYVTMNSLARGSITGLA